MCEHYYQRWPSNEETSQALRGSLCTVSSYAERGWISIYNRTYVTTDSDQIGQIYLGEKELKVRRTGHDAMMEQDAYHNGYEADVTAHLLDTNGKKIESQGFWTQER